MLVILKGRWWLESNESEHHICRRNIQLVSLQTLNVESEMCEHCWFPSTKISGLNEVNLPNMGSGWPGIDAANGLSGVFLCPSIHLSPKSHILLHAGQQCCFDWKPVLCTGLPGFKVWCPQLYEFMGPWVLSWLWIYGKATGNPAAAVQCCCSRGTDSMWKDTTRLSATCFHQSDIVIKLKETRLINKKGLWKPKKRENQIFDLSGKSSGLFLCVWSQKEENRLTCCY